MNGGEPYPTDPEPEVTIGTWRAGIEDLVRAGGKARVGRVVTVQPGRFECNGHAVQLGSFRVFRVFTSFAAPLALYACQQLLLRRKVAALMNYEDFSGPPPQQVVATDVGRHETVFANYMARLEGLMVSCVHRPEGLMIAAYAPSEEAAIGFFADLEAEMSASNIYRGKCLYFSGPEPEFKRTPETAWEEVILEARLKDEIILNTARFLASPNLHRRGILKRGLILHGAPGTGKTTIVRALFRELEGTEITRIYLTNEAFAHISMDDFFRMLRYVLPAIVVFEDIDLIGPARHIRRGGVIGSLLTQLDGVDKVRQPLVVVGTTNDFDAVDEALVNRPARFDRVLEIPRPSEPEIREFYRRLAGFEPDAKLVQASDGFTGAHIEEVVRTAIMMAEEASGGAKPEEFVMRAVLTVRNSFGTPARAGFAPPKRPLEEFGEALSAPRRIAVPQRNPLTIRPDTRPDEKNIPDELKNRDKWRLST